MTNALVERDDKGRFIPGQSGNPEGKAKGLRNYITHERLMLESALRDFVGQPEQQQKLLDGIERILAIAAAGDDQQAISAMKLLLDRVMPAMPIKEAEEESTPHRVLEIIIRTNPDAKVPVQAVIDGDFTVIEESPCPATSKQDKRPTKTRAVKERTASTEKATTSSQAPRSRPAKAKSQTGSVAKKVRSSAKR